MKCKHTLILFLYFCGFIIDGRVRRYGGRGRQRVSMRDTRTRCGGSRTRGGPRCNTRLNDQVGNNVTAALYIFPPKLSDGNSNFDI